MTQQELTGVDIIVGLTDDYGYSKSSLAHVAGISIPELRAIKNGESVLNSMALKNLDSLLAWSNAVKDNLLVNPAAWFENHLVILGEGHEKKVIHCYEIPALHLMSWPEFTEYTIANSSTFYTFEDFAKDYPMEWTVKTIDGEKSLVGRYGIDFLHNHQYSRDWAFRKLHNL